MTPAGVLIPIQTKARRAATKEHGMRILKGPVLSAMKLGIWSYGVSVRRIVERGLPPTYYPSKEGSGIQEHEQVKCQVLPQDVLFNGVGLDVEKRDIQPHEAEERTECEKSVWRFSPSCGLKDTPLHRGLHAHFHTRQRDDQSREHDKGYHPRRPSKAYSRLKLPEDNWIDNATCSIISNDGSRHRTCSELPRLLPLAAMPCAKALFVEKYVGRMAMLGTKRQPLPRPTTKACASMTCQYVVHKLVIIIPKTTKKLPVDTRARR